MGRAMSILSCVAGLLVLAGSAIAGPSAAEAYLEFRRWFNAQHEDVRSGDVPAAADFGKGETRVVRLLAMKESWDAP